MPSVRAPSLHPLAFPAAEAEHPDDFSSLSSTTSPTPIHDLKPPKRGWNRATAAPPCRPSPISLTVNFQLPAPEIEIAAVFPPCAATASPALRFLSPSEQRWLPHAVGLTTCRPQPIRSPLKMLVSLAAALPQVFLPITVTSGLLLAGGMVLAHVSASPLTVISMPCMHHGEQHGNPHLRICTTVPVFASPLLRPCRSCE